MWAVDVPSQASLQLANSHRDLSLEICRASLGVQRQLLDPGKQNFSLLLAKHSEAGFEDEITLNVPVGLRGQGAGGLEECLFCCTVAYNQKGKKPLAVVLE